MLMSLLRESVQKLTADNKQKNQIISLPLLTAVVIALQESAFADTKVSVPGKRKHVIKVDKDPGQHIIIKESPEHGSVEVDQSKGTITYISDAEKDAPPPDSYIYDLDDDSSSAIWLLGLLAVIAAVGAGAGACSGSKGETPAIPVDYDFGDLPETPIDADPPAMAEPINTLLANDGPRHIIDPDKTLHFFDESDLGPTEAAPDAEADGQPTLDADGDDLSNLDDETQSSLTITTFADASTPTLDFLVANLTSEEAYVSVWIDANNNELWDMADDGSFEFVLQGFVIGANHVGAVTATVESMAQQTIENMALNLSQNFDEAVAVRMRISTDKDAVMSPNGLAPDGEVEDFFIDVNSLVFIQEDTLII